MARPVLPQTRPRLYQIRRDLTAVSPAAFLAAAHGKPRGFWASGRRWVAHAGAVAEVGVDGGREDAGSPDRRSRFAVVQDHSARLFAKIGGEGGARLFGGFAFSARPCGDPVWSSFPPARFQLPEAELEHDPRAGQCSLLVRGADRKEAEKSWGRWADTLSRSGAAESPGPPRRGRPGVRPARKARAAERAAWSRMVWRTLHRIQAGEAEKVVLARTLDVTPTRPVPPLDLVLALWQEGHGSHVFLFEPAPAEALVGAAPETIATVVNGVVRATAVAGSVRVGADSVETAKLARRLFNSDKDRAEHDLVVRDMLARLSGLGCTVERDVEPHVLTLARIQHLETKIAAGIPEGVTLLDILASLHPTPAVCGMPRNAALSILTGSEVFDRGWYAGPVGWMGSDGKGMFVPALRSAVSRGAGWRLFAGAGILPGSDPSLEWEETELKFDSVLRAIARAEFSAHAATGSG
ncbi:MAG: isochorismate synthase [Gemmatimonadota bacterium]|nr:isochorismate synthase [Gemmatimonadota bacterium]MDE2984073.1 isochorismate synthase [Gemmatimonadota bacterium]